MGKYTFQKKIQKSLNLHPSLSTLQVPIKTKPRISVCVRQSQEIISIPEIKKSWMKYIRYSHQKLLLYCLLPSDNIPCLAITHNNLSKYYVQNTLPYLTYWHLTNLQDKQDTSHTSPLPISINPSNFIGILYFVLNRKSVYIHKSIQQPCVSGWLTIP